MKSPVPAMTDQPTTLNDCLELLASLPDAELEPRYAHEPSLPAMAAYSRAAMRELLTSGDINAHDEEDCSALVYARNSPRLVRALLAAGATPAQCSEDEILTMLDTTVPLETAALLLAAGAAPNVREDEESPLHVACMDDDAPRVRLLLAHGANPHARWMDGMTPLFHARSAEVAELLLAAGADPNAEDIDGCRPIHQCPAALTRVLLAHGADVHPTQLYGVTALALAEEEEKIQLLRAAGARLIDADLVWAWSQQQLGGKSRKWLEEWVRLRGADMKDLAAAVRREEAAENR